MKRARQALADPIERNAMHGENESFTIEPTIPDHKGYGMKAPNASIPHVNSARKGRKGRTR